MRIGLETLAGVSSPRDAVLCFYPPHPENSEQTLDWLIEQDLVEVKKLSFDGQPFPIQKGGNA
jgi:hypothetical protein